MFSKIKNKLKNVFKSSEDVIEKEEEIILEEKGEKSFEKKKEKLVKKKSKKIQLKQENQVGENDDEIDKQEKKSSKGFFQKMFSKEEDKIESNEKNDEEKEIENETENIEKESDEGFFSKTFSKLKSKKITIEDFEKIWIELEIFLLEINIAFEIVEKIELKLKKELIDESFDRFNLSKKIREVLENEVEKVLKNREDDLLKRILDLKTQEKGAIKILILGVNGTGKTTSIAKIVKYFQKNNLSVVVAAADTFRAAAVEQLEEHSKKLNFKLIMHKNGSDPAAVAYDSIEHAKAKNLDIVLIDTAGRMPNNSNLMGELEKVRRISNSQINIFIGDSISGNDLIEQINLFNKIIPIDGIILTKIDTDERPGSIVTTAYSIEKPIYFLGNGQNYDDLIKFDSKLIAKKLFEIDE